MAELGWSLGLSNTRAGDSPSPVTSWLRVLSEKTLLKHEQLLTTEKDKNTEERNKNHKPGAKDVLV